jgi:hypothetical protein
MRRMTDEPDPLIAAALRVKERDPHLSVEEIAAATAAAALLPAPLSVDVIARIAQALHDR